MKPVLFVITVGIVISTLRAETIISSGKVYGTWTAAQSPYIVQGEIWINPGDTLTIEPGVQVRFTGNYKFRVQGRLVAQGTETDSILFTRHYPTEESRWRGLRFEHPDSTSILEYCRIEWAFNATELYGAARGGGVYVDGTLNIGHCRINDNYTHNQYYNGLGGGICFDDYSKGTVEYCHIIRNQSDAGAGLAVNKYGVNICNNLIEYNIALHESGGGIYVGAESISLVSDNIIRYNQAEGYWFGGGGIALRGLGSLVHHNLIHHNTTGKVGGGIYVQDDSHIFNNTIVYNLSDTSTGGIYQTNQPWHSPPFIINNIVWGNQAPDGIQIFQEWGPIIVTYNDVQGGWPGTGNINAYPAFVNPDSGDYHLQWFSQCIDAGNPLSPFDPDSTIADMGAFYYDQTVGISQRPEVRIPTEYALHPCHPNPFNPSTVIRFDLPQATHVRLAVFDTAGRRVAGARHASPLPAGEAWYQAGQHEVTFDAAGLSSGVYLVRMEAGGMSQVQKVVLLK